MYILFKYYEVSKASKAPHCFLHMFFILKTMCIVITESVYVSHQPRRSVRTRFRSANEVLVRIWENESNFGPEVDLPIKTQKRVFKISMHIHEANKLYTVQPRIVRHIGFLLSST